MSAIRVAHGCVTLGAMLEENLACATYAIVDVETTGFDPVDDRVVEIACLVIRQGLVIDSFSTLVNPGRAIPAAASAVHGIHDRDVVYAPALHEVERRLRAMTRGAVLVAHNAQFDMAFLPFLSGRPVICTLRLGMHLVDTTSYKNQALCEALGIKADSQSAVAHHAAADARITARVLLALLRIYAGQAREQTVPGLIATIARPALLGRFAFGQYRGEPIGGVPSEYLRLILEGGFEDWPDVRYTAARELESRDMTAAA